MNTGRWRARNEELRHFLTNIYTYIFITLLDIFSARQVAAEKQTHMSIKERLHQ